MLVTKSLRQAAIRVHFSGLVDTNSCSVHNLHSLSRRSEIYAYLRNFIEESY